MSPHTVDSQPARIPEHLLEYITDQNPNLYTPIDHATWRYIMRVSKKFFENTAHPLYLNGLESTGISIERIPLVTEMDAILKKMGWRAVAINGFIPPSIFLEFGSLRILPIACDIRKLENLGYTPSPDIVHEAAGHAPILADPGYRRFLESFGEVARNAIIDRYDLDLYEAIRVLSEVKEDPHSSEEVVQEAQKNFEAVAGQSVEPSEAALLARFNWWTAEYGLIGPMERPLIYGAGLLSSVDESFNCIQPGTKVKWVPFSLDAVVNTAYDITRPQPQLFVAESFSQLTEALERFSLTMAYRLGGVHGLTIGKRANNTVTVVMESGLQLTGIIDDFETNAAGDPVSVTLSGAKQISFGDTVATEVSHHHFGQTLYLPFVDRAVANASLSDIQRKLHGSGLLTLSGARILGRFKREFTLGGRARVLILENTRILAQNGDLLFEERKKDYPLMISNKVTSVFGGAADRAEFGMRSLNRTSRVNRHRTNKTSENERLCELYQVVRDFREGRVLRLEALDFELKELLDFYQNDWLLRLEFYELYQKYQPNSVTTARLRKELMEFQTREPKISELIRRGLELIQ